MSGLGETYNPCISCGICCTHFRISFYWAEADDAPGGFVPADMTEKLNLHLRCMKGSNQEPRRCIALQGELGQSVSCSIYPQRPSPCREFPVYFDDGTPNPRCDELRARIGLPPLLPLMPAPHVGEIVVPPDVAPAMPVTADAPAAATATGAAAAVTPLPPGSDMGGETPPLLN